MKLNLVYGRSGCGKSTFIFEDIKAKIGTKKIFIIVPEQCNLSTEKKLFENVEQKALIDVEVLTLSRMAYRVSNEIGGVYNNLSKVGKDMIIFDVLKLEPTTAQFFLDMGMHCLGCPASRGETIEQACAVHGTDADALIAEINRFLESKK